MIELENNKLRILMHNHDDGYYLGTRFDRAGIFAGMHLDGGPNLTGEWFDRYDPFMHDAVCGPAEEFSPIGFRGKGGSFLKIGVGLLANPYDEPYDRFRLYPVEDAGSRETVRQSDRCTFTHILDTPQGWGYVYNKTIVLKDRGFDILHELRNTGSLPLEGDCYNHNFFTFAKDSTGPGRRICFGFDPHGKWRAPYESVSLQECRLEFSRTLRKGESVYMGDIRAKGQDETPYLFSIAEGASAIDIRGDVPVSRAVFWANHRIACIEPYTDFAIGPEESMRFGIEYRMNANFGRKCFGLPGE